MAQEHLKDLRELCEFYIASPLGAVPTYRDAFLFTYSLSVATQIRRAKISVSHALEALGHVSMNVAMRPPEWTPQIGAPFATVFEYYNRCVEPVYQLNLSTWNKYSITSLYYSQVHTPYTPIPPLQFTTISDVSRIRAAVVAEFARYTYAALSGQTQHVGLSALCIFIAIKIRTVQVGAMDTNLSETQLRMIRQLPSAEQFYASILRVCHAGLGADRLHAMFGAIFDAVGYAYLLAQITWFAQKWNQQLCGPEFVRKYSLNPAIGVATNREYALFHNLVFLAALSEQM